MKSVEVFSLGTRLMLKGSKELKNTLSRLVMKESWFLQKPISRHVLVISDKIHPGVHTEPTVTYCIPEGIASKLPSQQRWKHKLPGCAERTYV